MISNRRFALALATLTVSFAVPAAFAQEPAPEAKSLEKAFKEDSFSPYANRNFPSMVLWGDTHLHTMLSPGPLTLHDADFPVKIGLET